MAEGEGGDRLQLYLYHPQLRHAAGADSHAASAKYRYAGALSRDGHPYASLTCYRVVYIETVVHKKIVRQRGIIIRMDIGYEEPGRSGPGFFCAVALWHENLGRYLQ